MVAFAEDADPAFAAIVRAAYTVPVAEDAAGVDAAIVTVCDVARIGRPISRFETVSESSQIRLTVDAGTTTPLRSSTAP